MIDDRPLGSRRATACSGGELSAMMLDTKSTFDGLVTRYAESDEQAQRILANNFYRNISGALSGTQEYMAMEKLHELHEDGGFDLIVVDTPPIAPRARLPRRAGRACCGCSTTAIFRLLMVPTRTGLQDRGRRGPGVHPHGLDGRRLGGRRRHRRVLPLVRGDGGGLPRRAPTTVVEILGQPETRFVLVTSPRRDAIEEARFFAERSATTTSRSMRSS